jgi:hypothetical protein
VEPKAPSLFTPQLNIIIFAPPERETQEAEGTLLGCLKVIPTRTMDLGLGVRVIVIVWVRVRVRVKAKSDPH